MTHPELEKPYVRLKNYDFYVEDIDSYVSSCAHDYSLQESPSVSIIENGFISPKHFPGQSGFNGGVCDAKGCFVSGHMRHSRQPEIMPGSCSSAYPISDEIPHIKETVVWGGFAPDHYGHMIVEGLSRMWWFLENPDSGYKFVFLAPGGKTRFLDFYRILGLHEEDIILIKEPTRFDSIIVPEQSRYLHHGFRNKDCSVFNAIRDSVVPAGYDKVYLTRTKFIPKDMINEEYFEAYYRAIGYEVISPEQLSIRDQVAVMAGAKEIACVSGTLAHQILFCHDGVKITILNRTKKVPYNQLTINMERKAKCTFCDVSNNFLPDHISYMAYLLTPTVYWKRYVENSANNTEFLHDHSVSIHQFCFEYITEWAKNAVFYLPSNSRFLKAFTLADVIIGVHKYLLGNDLDESTKKRLFDIFDLQPQLRQLQESVKKLTQLNQEMKMRTSTGGGMSAEQSADLQQRYNRLEKEANNAKAVSKQLADLTVAHKDLEQRYKRLKSSLSWKMTSPVRAIGRVLRLPKKK